ncbi:MAG: nucleotide exchange factor GrpE [Candidatus Nealsonbacteria bacterium]|nr:nucleotide exchange factor GrpE [Candidatus Nealsonbacteria bacterium]
MGEDLKPASAKASAGEEKLEECEKKAAEYLAGWQRARADFLNYKKEEMERIAEILKYGAEEMILKILPILDNFEIIESKLPEDLKKNENMKGILQIKKQISDFLKNQGVEEIKSVGEKFDPNWHEVVEPASAEASAGKESGVIVDEAQKGYKINGKLLRPAKVKIVK